MSKLAESTGVTLPAPTMGVDWSVPSDIVQYPYTPCSLDWIANGNEVKIRDEHYQLPQTSSETITGMASYEAENTIMMSISGGAKAGLCEYDLSTETLTNVSATALSFRSHVNYQGRVFFATRTTGYSWDGTTLSAAFTGASGSLFVPPACCIYRDRYIQVAGQTLYFAPTAGAVSGALSSFNLASYYSSGFFYACASITINDSNNLSDYLILLTYSGDIIAFTGDFPGSANWQLIVKTKIPVEDQAICSLTPYAGDAFIFVSKPATLLSAKTLIQEGRLAAEASSLLAKQVAFIRESASSEIKNVAVYAKKNALIIETYFNTEFNDKIFGFTPESQVSNWLYVDINSGAVSPFSFENFGSSGTTIGTLGGYVISHSDGYIYSKLADISGGAYRLFDDTASDTQEDNNSFLQFPYSDLGLPDSVKSLKMAFPYMSRYGGFAEAKLAIDYDYDADQVQTFDSASGSASASNLVTKRLIVPISGQGNQISLALINKRRPRLMCQRIGLQFEQGGPY